jgi:hypothetical protein
LKLSCEIRIHWMSVPLDLPNSHFFVVSFSHFTVIVCSNRYQKCVPFHVC